jgi:putative ABC transport system permease protein
MNRLRAWMLRLAGSVWTGRRDGDFASELESHLQLHIDDQVRSGVAPDEARRRALISLGGVEQTKERLRDRERLPWLDAALQDLRGSLRLMRRTPGFTLFALLTLALGVGANSVMFSIVNSLLLRPLPYPDADRLVSIQTLDPAGRWAGTAPPDFYAYREGSRTFDFLDAYYGGVFNLTGDREAERLPGLIVSSGFFASLGSPPQLGRGFIADDERWGSHRVVVITDGLWRRRFGASPAVVGQGLTVNAEPYTVIGVLPPGFSFLGRDLQLFAPMAFEPGDNMNSHNNNFLNMLGRIKADAGRERAFADLNTLSDAAQRAHQLNRGTTIGIEPLQELVVRDVRRSVLVLLGAVAFVLLISCANLANLLLARGAARGREVAVRTAIGATRARLVRQLLTESVVLSLLGGGAGLALAFGAIDALNLLSQSILPRAEAVRIDPTVLGFTLATAVVTGVLFGLAPAIRTSAVNLTAGLKDGAPTASAGGASYRLRRVLVVAEIALSLLLLIGAGLMVKSMYRLLNVDGGFDAEGVLTLRIDLPQRKYVDGQLARQFSPLAYAKATRFFDDTVERVRSLAGVRAAGLVSGLPLMGENWGKNLTLLDRPLPATLNDLEPYQFRVVAGDYFRAMGIRLLSGRGFEPTDTGQSTNVVIVNETLARRHWQDGSPIGRTVLLNPPLELVPAAALQQARRAGLPDDYAPPPFTIVGVVDDVRHGSLTRAALPTVYALHAQASEGMTTMFLAVRTDGDPLALVSPIRGQIRQIDPDQPVSAIQTMAARLASSVSQRRTEMVVLSGFALVALLVAAIGIYGVMSYWVTERRTEIGIRLALGAERGQVVGLVLRQAAAMLGVGLVFGIAGALAMTRVLQALLYEVSASDPSVFGALAVVLAAAGVLAAYIPARRATRVDPIATLRYE